MVRPRTDDDDMTKLLVLQGANMAYLGRRQPELYGTTTAAELDQKLRQHARSNDYDLDIFYTHIEGEAIERLYQAVDQGVDGVVMNPAGFLYAGYALRDCLRAVSFPYIEVHITNIEKRGMHSVLAEASVGVIAGFGLSSYVLGLEAMLRIVRSQSSNKGLYPPMPPLHQ
jgi:3-dehydroquinate dehydratase-2